jgi:uncharacterized protein (DUF1015 family)
MATIKPFRAMQPNPFYADQLVFTSPQAESVSGGQGPAGVLPPLKTLLETGARQRPETPEGQALAYDDITGTLRYLLDTERLWLDKSPAIYIYQVSHGAYSQTGVWAGLDLSDSIRTHELTFDDSVRRLKNYREHTGLEGSPILLTYSPNGTIDRILDETKAAYPVIRYEGISAVHQLWRVAEPEKLHVLCGAFKTIGNVYLADGHHRHLSAGKLLKEQLQNGQQPFDTISALFMSAAELKMGPYHRVFLPDVPVSRDWLMEKLLPLFYIQGSLNNRPVQPVAQHRFGLYFDGEWFELRAKPKCHAGSHGAVALDVAILQDKVLAPLFGVCDPATDARLKHAGGEHALAEMALLFRPNPHAIGFTLCPLTLTELVAAADEGVNIPPKSTWIDPKVPYGLLINCHLNPEYNQ